MATTKKTPTSKKKLIPAKARPVTWKFYVVSIGIFLVAVSSFVVIALLASHNIAANQASSRYDRINAIYSSINVGESYRVESKNIFGDKRSYESEKGRTFSSVITYLHAATVSDTVSDLDAKIKAAGFTFVEQVYPGSAAPQYHYKSEKGEYVRLTVSSKPYDDALQNASLMNGDVAKLQSTLDKNAGPSNVILKVNLDDNNE